MTVRRFRPTLWATVAAGAGFLVLVGLGVWQLQRLHWKEALIAERDDRLAAPAIALPDDLERAEDLEYRRVRASGRFDQGRELHLAARAYKGRVGVHVVTPFALDDGRTVLVDRGWVPPELSDPARRAQAQADRPVTLEAVARTGGWKGSDWFRPDNDPRSGSWLWIDPAAMLAEAGAARPVTGIYLQAVEPTGPGDWPRPVPPAVDLRNDHLEYAVTWFGLAVVLAVIYVLMHLQRPADRR